MVYIKRYNKAINSYPVVCILLLKQKLYTSHSELIPYINKQFRRYLLLSILVFFYFIFVVDIFIYLSILKCLKVYLYLSICIKNTLTKITVFLIWFFSMIVSNNGLFSLSSNEFELIIINVLFIYVVWSNVFLIYLFLELLTVVSHLHLCHFVYTVKVNFLTFLFILHAFEMTTTVSQFFKIKVHFFVCSRYTVLFWE